MALNFPGPYEVRIYYTVNPNSTFALTHVQRLNFQSSDINPPSTEFDSIPVLRRDLTIPGAGDDLESIVDAWITLIRPLWTVNGNFTHAECWFYEPESFNATFISAYDIGVAGSGSGTMVAAGQVIHTYRTLEGGVMKLNFMETLTAAGQATALSAATSTHGSIRNFILSDDNPWLGRDTSYPFAGMKFLPGQNEALFKRRFRQI